MSPREPELYACVHQGNPGDVAFYRRIAAGASDILELGCGYGRVLLPLAGDGHRVTGLDLDAGLLELARVATAHVPGDVRARIRLLRADMRDFSLAHRFQWIVIPYNGLYGLDTEAQQLACLRTAAAHLAPGGRLVFDAYVIDNFHATANPQACAPDDDEPVTTVRWRDTDYDVFETSHWEREAQRFQVHYRYVSRDGGPSYEDRIAHRYLLTEQVPGLCAAAGLRVAALFGGFADEPLTPLSEHQVCVAEMA